MAPNFWASFQKLDFTGLSHIMEPVTPILMLDGNIGNSYLELTLDTMLNFRYLQLI